MMWWLAKLHVGVEHTKVIINHLFILFVIFYEFSHDDVWKEIYIILCLYMYKKIIWKTQVIPQVNIMYSYRLKNSVAKV